jgi:hypothetical protein
VARRAAEQGKVAYVPRGNTNTDCFEDRRTVYYIIIIIIIIIITTTTVTYIF